MALLESIQFGNQIGWYGFASLLILALLYLMRPKPIEKSIPSLMFFMREKGFSKRIAFFRRLFSNLLFLIQLLALAALAFALTQPYTTLFGTGAIENTVIVLDTSASMQAGNRLQDAVASAKSSLHGDVTIILAQNVPLLVLDQGSREEASRLLSSIGASDTTSNIGDAILQAGESLKEKTGKVYVYSDFAGTEGPDPLVAKRILASRNIPTEFVNMGGRKDNAGIIDMALGKSTTKAIVKNYYDQEKTVTLAVLSSSGTQTIEKKILPNSIEIYDFKTPKGDSELRIDTNDELEIDNHAYISAQGIKKIRVLLVTNADKSNLKTALQSSQDIELQIAEPPVIPNLDFDIIIIHKVSPGMILPDFYPEAKRKVSNGTSLIITSQDEMTEFSQLLPVEIHRLENSSRVETRITNALTTDIDFGIAFKYYNSTPKEGATVIAEANGAPMLAMKEEGIGKVIYYGILDDFSDFKTTVSYPIFWSKLINFLTQTEDLNDYNFRTGKIIAAAEGKKYMDKAGFYNVGSKRLSASLLSEKESDIASENIKLFEEERLFSKSQGQEKRDVKFEQILIALGLAIVILELLYIKWRGDL